MLERVKTARPGARLDGFLLQPMVHRPGAVELLVGLVEDPVFGPLVAFGQGGTAVEVVHDMSLELPPLNALLARRLMARTRVWQLLQGYRGKSPANIEAVVEVLIRLGQLAADNPEIRELDINPLLADAAGIVALDARLRVAPAQTARASRLAIAPYPKEFESVEQLRDGTALRMRPLRPEDEPMLHDLAAHMSNEDLRLRFFTPMHGLTHAVAARLSQLDYDRELALLAAHDGMALGRGALLCRSRQIARRIRNRRPQRLARARCRVPADEPPHRHRTAARHRRARRRGLARERADAADVPRAQLHDCPAAESIPPFCWSKRFLVTTERIDLDQRARTGSTPILKQGRPHRQGASNSH